MAEGVDNGNVARTWIPTYEQAMDMAPHDLLERLTIEETPDHLVAVRLAEHACRRFRDEYDTSRRWRTSGDIGTLALLGQANALRALRAEQAGFSRGYVDLAMGQSYSDLKDAHTEIYDARVRAITSHLGIAAIRHLRLDQHERGLKQRAFLARRARRPDTEAIEERHMKAVNAIATQRDQSNWIRRQASDAQYYLRGQRTEDADYWPQSKVRLSAAKAALEIAAGEPHQAIRIARQIAQIARETWWEDITPDGYADFVQHWQSAADDLAKLARRSYLPDILGAHGRRQARLSQMLGSPNLDTIPEYPPEPLDPLAGDIRLRKY